MLAIWMVPRNRLTTMIIRHYWCPDWLRRWCDLGITTLECGRGSTLVLVGFVSSSLWLPVTIFFSIPNGLNLGMLLAFPPQDIWGLECGCIAHGTFHRRIPVEARLRFQGTNVTLVGCLSPILLDRFWRVSLGTYLVIHPSQSSAGTSWWLLTSAWLTSSTLTLRFSFVIINFSASLPYTWISLNQIQHPLLAFSVHFNATLSDKASSRIKSKMHFLFWKMEPPNTSTDPPRKPICYGRALTYKASTEPLRYLKRRNLKTYPSQVLPNNWRVPSLQLDSNG